MALINNACPTCTEISTSLNSEIHGNPSEVNLSENDENKLKQGLITVISNGGSCLIIIPDHVMPSYGGTCYYLYFGNIGSSSWGVKFGTCSYMGNALIQEFTESNVIDIY